MKESFHGFLPYDLKGKTKPAAQWRDGRGISPPSGGIPNTARQLSRTQRVPNELRVWDGTRKSANDGSRTQFDKQAASLLLRGAFLIGRNSLSLASPAYVPHTDSTPGTGRQLGPWRVSRFRCGLVRHPVPYPGGQLPGFPATRCKFSCLREQGDSGPAPQDFPWLKETYQ